MDRGTILEEAGNYGVVSTHSVFPKPIIWVQVVIDAVKAAPCLTKIHSGFTHRNSLQRFRQSLFLIDTAAGNKQPIFCRRVFSLAYQNFSSMVYDQKIQRNPHRIPDHLLEAIKWGELHVFNHKGFLWLAVFRYSPAF